MSLGIGSSIASTPTAYFLSVGSQPPDKLPGQVLWTDVGTSAGTPHQALSPGPGSKAHIKLKWVGGTNHSYQQRGFRFLFPFFLFFKFI